MSSSNDNDLVTPLVLLFFATSVAARMFEREQFRSPDTSLGVDEYNQTGQFSLNTFLDDLVNPTRYDKRIRPFKRSNCKINVMINNRGELYFTLVPCNVTMTVHINSISAINEVTMDFNIDLYFRQIWVDPRLRYDHTCHSKDSPLVLHYDLIDRIWVPDSYFRNAKEGKRSDITVPNRLTRIYKDGTVLYSQRLLLKLDCPMKLQKFPMDNQTCLINIGSYGFTLDDLKFEWSDQEAPIGLSAIEMPDFLMEQFEAVKCQRKTSTGSYPCLEIKLWMKRLFGYYFVQVYIPSILLVIMCSLSFWVDYRSAPARISMGLMNVVAIVTQSSGTVSIMFYLDNAKLGIRGQLPKVSYIKAIDVWMLMCLVFAFLALCEYVVVNVLAWKAECTRQNFLAEKHQPKKRIYNRLGILHRFHHNNFACDKIVGTRLATGHSAFQSKPKWSTSSGAAILPPESSTDSTFISPLSTEKQKSDPLLTPQQAHQVTSSPHQIRSSILAGQSINGQVRSPPKAQRNTSNVAVTMSIKDNARKVDKISAFVFPVMFVLFNVVYWSYFMNITV